MQTVWLILLIIFAGVEGITAGLVSVWFCAGSLVALIATWLGAGLPVQIALFVVVSLVAMALVRPGRHSPRRAKVRSRCSFQFIADLLWMFSAHQGVVAPAV